MLGGNYTLIVGMADQKVQSVAFMVCLKEKTRHFFAF